MILKKFFRKKSFNQFNEDADSKSFNRSFNAIQLIFLGIGAIVGGGIFVLTGFASYHYAGPSIVISFALSGFVCMCAGFCYAELASLAPVAGGPYSYTYAILGELPAWLMGWAVIFAYFLSASSVANGWSSYLVGLLSDLNIFLDPRLVNVAGYDIGGGVKAIFNFPSFVVSVFCSVILIRGTETSSVFNIVIVIIKMSILVLFVILGSAVINTENWSPFMPQNEGVFGRYGVSGIFAGTTMVFMAFSGFDSICTTAQETKNPKKDLPIGIIGSIAIATIFYIIIALVLTGIVNYKDLNTLQPISLAAEKIDMPIFTIFVKIGGLAALTSVILVHQYAMIRIIYTMAKDGLLPKFFTEMHHKYQSPVYITVVVGTAMGIISGFFSLDKLAQIGSFFIVLSIIIVCSSVLYLKYKEPNLPRSFVAPFSPFLPIVAILLALQLIYSYPLSTLINSFLLLLITFIYYLFSSVIKSGSED